jgi:predicted methyltransferase
LNVQGRALAAPTRALLEAAGLRGGMRVLDLGSGAGDMSFVVADLVGDGGEVVGVERAAEAIAEATVRRNGKVAPMCASSRAIFTTLSTTKSLMRPSAGWFLVRAGSRGSREDTGQFGTPRWHRRAD